jgi:hypothetical protein
MNAWFPLLKAKTILVFDVALLAAGLVPVLYFMALFVWQISAIFYAGAWFALPATLLFADRSVLQAGAAAPVLAFIPQFPWPWLMSPDSLLPVHAAVTWILDRTHVGLVPALVGLAVMPVGALGAIRQMAVIRGGKQRDEDRLRRVQDYRRADFRTDALDGRREPFIGSGGSARNADRRVA